MMDNKGEKKSTFQAYHGVPVGAKFHMSAKDEVLKRMMDNKGELMLYLVEERLVNL